MYRTKYCAEFNESDIGTRAKVCGWVQKQRDLGTLIFVDLRDRTGIIQLAFDDKTDKEIFDIAFGVRAEYVLCAEGVIRSRGEGAINPNMKTGMLELYVDKLEVLSVAQTPPFEIKEETDVKEELRLKYRYLDLRRAPLQRNILMRSRVARHTREYFEDNGFIEIETPVLIKSTPEGARDYLVPSRVHPGSFYALPQSPQLYKQLLMLSGFDRYIQIAKCFRDEDLRADRQPEFTQIDLEMSFVDENDIMTMVEGFIASLFDKVMGMKVELPLRRMTWDEAMNRYGSDKPDLRFGFEICDLSDVLKNTEFKVFGGAIAEGGSVRAINIKGGADKFSRKEIDKLTDFVKTYRAKGLAWSKWADEVSSSFAKFLTEEETNAIYAKTEFEKGDLLLVVADSKNKVVFDSLGALRCEVAEKLGLRDKNVFNFLWITDFPMFEYSEEDDRWVAMHHPFTAPREEDIQYLKSAPDKVYARAYDIVLNGTELGGGSVRIHRQDLQAKVFDALGLSPEEIEVKFGFLLEAFKYGAPPHAGLAFGLDRLVSLMLGLDAIRDVIAFPKVQNASELMTQCPSEVPEKSLDELGICIK
ncbi:MAG: aspartate--tRNA ligase [Clostridia bacterium]|nr:aspartate--tRNA ligase [Clostridia bacterium]